MTYHYAREDLLSALAAAGIGRGDVVSLQVSLGRIGLARGVAPDYRSQANFVIDAYLEVLGPHGTLIVPTYSYSIGRGEVFEVEVTPSALGEFTEVFRKRSDTIRSRDPMLSSAGIGPAALDVLRASSRSCYGSGSTFHQLRIVGAKICTLGVSLYYATFRHHIEEMANVPFRFVKHFTGTVRERGEESQETWMYFAAPHVANCSPDGLRLERKVRAAQLLAIAPVGRGELMVIGAREYFDFGIAELCDDPWLTAKGPPAPAAVLFACEEQWLASQNAGQRAYSRN